MVMGAYKVLYSSHILSSWMVFMLQAFTRLGHECQEILNLDDGMHTCAQRLDLGLYSHLKDFLGNGASTHLNSKGKIPFTKGSE